MHRQVRINRIAKKVLEEVPWGLGGFGQWVPGKVPEGFGGKLAGFNVVSENVLEKVL